MTIAVGGATSIASAAPSGPIYHDHGTDTGDNGRIISGPVVSGPTNYDPDDPGPYDPGPYNPFLDRVAPVGRL
ncbi:MAG: hypothetical protein GX610_23095 [Rhodococcus sp.]|nr:hypothetical protein [Rhodococcus sp. (in: high G+C Gram-positive bacteria)]